MKIRTQIKTARSGLLRCGVCHADIGTGERYFRFNTRAGERIRCHRHDPHQAEYVLDRNDSGLHLHETFRSDLEHHGRARTVCNLSVPLQQATAESGGVTCPACVGLRSLAAEEDEEYRRQLEDDDRERDYLRRKETMWNP